VMPAAIHVLANCFTALCLLDCVQVVSGGADKQLRLWSGEGMQLARVDTGFQVTALACSDCSVAVGGACGEVQLAVLGPPAEQQGEEQHSRQAEGSARPQQCEQVRGRHGV